MTKRNLLWGCLLMCLHLGVSAQPIAPNLRGSALANHIRANYSPSQVYSYARARDTLYRRVDIDLTTLDVQGIYTGYTIRLNPNQDPSSYLYQSGQGINAEHVYPQSKGAKQGNARSDMHHLYASYAPVNSSRGSCAFGEIDDAQTSTWFLGGASQSGIPANNIDAYSEKLDSGNGQSCRFEPRESKKGDIARAVFYFYTIYQSSADAKDPHFFHNMKQTLYQWHLQDPADATDSLRSARVQHYQGNHNPFVLDSSLVRRIYFAPATSTRAVAAQTELATLHYTAQGVRLVQTKQAFNTEFRVFNMLGQHIESGDFSTDRIELNTESLEAGMYVIQLQNEQGFQTLRFVRP